MIITTTLNNDDEKEFFKIQKHENKTQIDILQEALDQYFSYKRKQRNKIKVLSSNANLNHKKDMPKHKQALLDSGFIEGSEDLSTNYKKYDNIMILDCFRQ